MKIKLSQIKPSPDNAAGRSEMNEAMEELIATIKAVGICEGISVRSKGEGYEVIGGERRLFAAKQAGIKEVDAIVHDVTQEQARRMRLASLAHEDWAYEEFAERVWIDLQDEGMTARKLAKETGLNHGRITDASNFMTGKMENAVVYNKRGEVLAFQTASIQSALKGVPYGTLRTQLAEKMTAEQTQQNQTYPLLKRIKKTFPNTVIFGESDDKDYEEHNFELDAVLQIAWGEDNYEKQISAMAEAKHKENRARWTAQRFGKKELKAFAKGANKWKDELRTILKFKKSFTWEQAQFTLNLLDEVADLVKGLTTELDSVMEEKDNG